MSPRWISLLLAAVVGAGIASGAALFWQEPRADDEDALADAVPDEAPRLAAVLRGLRQELSQAREAHRRLEQQVADLGTRLAELEDLPAPVPVPVPAAGRVAAGGAGPVSRRAGEGSFDEPALVAAGVDAAEARWLHERYDEYEMERLYVMDRVQREGWEQLPRGRHTLGDLERDLRAELGEARYDQFLYALGRNNRAVVRDVLTGSPAAEAGFRKRDMVLRYDDTRIYSPQELRKATQGGEAGELVPIELLRSGDRIRVFVPRGPLGVTLEADRRTPEVG